ncbi:MAG: DEAD/DEAH box helicase [Parachlamydiaceae bacterium]
MIILPPVLKKFQKEARECLAAGRARDIEFSSGTYQVLVVDPHSNKEEWAFLQIDGQGRLKDSFCSCSHSENGHPCVHQAAAFLHIYGNHPLPLHQRFEQSLWSTLCRCCSDYMGNKSDQLRATKEGRYVCRGDRSKVIFSIQGTTPDALHHLEHLLLERREETEETSLKFSNLSEEELFLWQKGKPTPQLAYELSFWSDLAKWLLALQEEAAPYKIEISYSPKKIPNGISVSFTGLELGWVLLEEWLPEIIPSLGTVECPLIVRTESTEGIEKVKYDKVNKCFVVDIKKRDKDFSHHHKHPKGIDFGQWTYIPEEGFYSREPCFLKDSKNLSDVEKMLNEHSSTLKKLVSGVAIREVPVSVSYAISFDNQWNLHIQTYLFTPGDLSAEGSQEFGTWVFVNGKGFYQWEGRYFDEIETVIEEKNVADFVSSHRIWFNTQEGFHTHLNPLSSDLNYRVTDDNYLVFSRNLSYQGEVGTTKDFGNLVYIFGQGFFCKIGLQSNTSIRAGATVPADQIPFFISSNLDELHLVKGFFSNETPIEKVKLTIHMISQGKIGVTPEYEFFARYSKENVRIFDEYSYVEGEGFCPLSYTDRLPEKYRQEMIVEGEALIPFITQEMDRLKPYIGTVDSRLKKVSQFSLVADQVEIKESEGHCDFSVKLEYQTPLGKLSLSSLWWALQKNQRFVMSDEGLFDLSDSRFGWLKHISKKKIDKLSNTLSLTSLEMLRLNALEEIDILPGEGASRKHSRKVLKDLKEFKTPKSPDLKGLTSNLRTYQQIGVQWLWFLYHHGLSGLLCDDMGLGKTHQAMALLAAVMNHWHEKKSSVKRRFLVVCPTSVIYHWQEKIALFLPGFKVWTFHGANRVMKTIDDDYDVLLTSYGIWRNQAEELGDIPFEVAIFDELQIAKNQTSRIYGALLKVTARMRLGMTGTPIENRLRELKALFDIVLPAYMPSENDYREHFVRPIEKEESSDRKKALANLVKPFVLRRKKEDVLLDLPEKIEELAHCDMLPDQRELYVNVLTASRDKLIEDLSDQNTPIPYMHIFTLFSHLKQICNHPAAYLKKASEYKQYQSGKWDLFLELLEEARESRQKVVVFSHYLSMLDIIVDYLEEHGIGFASIRGATVNRGEELQRFNNNPECEVFVASLQAAGLGVDLTAGSVVIHYDRWWNAARENQATDRVHRIGQTRGVQVFKLMTKGTIEEHIDFLISKKGRLMDDVVSVDDHQTIKKFDRQEIIQLLKTIPQ